MNAAQDFLSDESKMAALAESGFFRGMNEALLRDVITQAEWLRLLAGETLMRQGDPGDSLFLVISGRLRAFYTNSLDREIAVGDIRRGETVGEMAILTQEPRSATVRTVRHSYHLSRWSLLWKTINPVAKNPSLPTLAKIMSRTTMLASVNNSEAMQRRADLYMHPLVDGIDMFAWDSLDDLAEIGYQYAMEHVVAWHKTLKAS